VKDLSLKAVSENFVATQMTACCRSLPRGNENILHLIFFHSGREDGCGKDWWLEAEFLVSGRSVLKKCFAKGIASKRKIFLKTFIFCPNFY
jgi:hypothetical protein